MKAVLPLCLALLLAPAAWSEERVFERDDYLKFFSPGRLASRSDHYHSTGVMEVVSNKTAQFAGRLFLAQTIEAIDVGPNYALSSLFPFYKVKSRTTEQLVWDEARKLWGFEYTEAEFDGDNSLVWESVNQDAEISTGDRAAGDLHDFYRSTDAREGRNPEAARAQYRKAVTGVWTWSCVWLEGEDFEAKCIATHQPTRRPEDYSYRRMDQVS